MSSIKRPRNPYILFQIENRPKLVDENPDLNFKEISKMLSLMWKALDADQKKIYSDKSKKEKKRYIDLKIESGIYRAKRSDKSMQEKYMNPFILYKSMYGWDDLKREMESRGEPVDFHSISKRFSTMWKELPIEEKQTYQKYSRDVEITRKKIISDNKKKRKLNPYITFSKSIRDQVKSDLDLSNLDNRERLSLISKEISKRWKNLDDDQKNSYRNN